MSNSPPCLSRAVFFASVTLAACGTLSQPEPSAAPPPSAPRSTPAPAAAPAPAPSTRSAPEASAELSEATLYELLLGEIALQRGDPGLAAQTYLELAKRTRDPR